MTDAKYQIVNGTFYKAETPTEVVMVLEAARKENRRLKLYYGSRFTGEDWNEENDTMGYIGRSTCEHKIPLLIKNSNSHGGGSILDDCIVKIKESKGSKVLYKCPNYVAPIMHIEKSAEPGYNYALYVNGKLYSNHETEAQAQRLMKKLA